MIHASPSTEERSRAEFARLTAPIAPHLQALDVFMEGEVNAFEPEVREPVSFCLQHSGKRIRPMLAFYGGWDPEQTSPPEALIRVAAVVEFVHLATLVHDDILDQAEVRHNATTVSRRYGPDVAVLLGDALFAHALKLAADFPTVEVCRAVSESTRRVCSGEIMQTFRRGDTTLDRDTYYRIIDLKTAELFRVACQLGASLAGKSSAFCEAAGTFGRHLGIAYQIFDDLADYLGSEDKAGKTLGTDLRACKATLPLLHFLDAIPAAERAHWVNQLQEGAISLSALREEMREQGVFPRVGAAFAESMAAAESSLAPFPDEPATLRLRALGDFVRLQIVRVNGEPMPTD